MRNISFDTKEDEFLEYFSTYGDVNYAKMCTNKETHMPTGTGFVQYKNEEVAQQLLEWSHQAEAIYDAHKGKRDKRKPEEGIFPC